MKIINTLSTLIYIKLRFKVVIDKGRLPESRLLSRYRFFSDAMFPNFFLNKIKNGINPKRSGDILVIQEPGWISSYTTGTSHGSLYEYDTHVPLIFYGWGLKPAEIVAPVEITDIAPTVAALLHILAPTGNIGNPIEGVVKQK